MNTYNSMQPLLSICIPTYNRCEILRQVLTSYSKNNEFDETVELVISDNASTDDTEIICREFANRINNIRYFRNESNIKDENFSKVISLGTGEYRKLMNDCVYLDEDGLRYIKHCIRKHLNDRKPLFFTGRFIDTQYKTNEFCVCNNLEDYIKAVSTWVTCNNLFGTWKEQWSEIKDKSQFSKLQLQQVDWTYQLIVNNSGCIVYNNPVFNTIFVAQSRGGYNWFKIHLCNYYCIMQNYIDKGLISQKTVTQDKLQLFRHFIPELTFVYVTKLPYRNWQFDTSGTLSYFWKHYKNEPTLWIHLFFFPLYSISYLSVWSFRKLRHKIKTKFFSSSNNNLKPENL